MSGIDRSASRTHQSTSSNGYSDLPEVNRTDSDRWGKEVASLEGKERVHDNVGMEVAGAEEKQGVMDTGIEVVGSTNSHTHYSDEASSGDGTAFNPTWRHWRRRNWMIAGVALLVTLGIALGVGLGVGLRSADQEGAVSEADSADSSGNVAMPSVSSTRGAMNGTGISMRRQSLANNLTTGLVGTSVEDARNLLLVYQHYNGELRWMQRIWPDTWLGGAESESITTEAKNGTPLSLMSTAAAGKMEWHVFYVDKNSKLRQHTYDNTTLQWQPGLLHDLSISTLDADKSGLVTCYYSGPINDPSFKQSQADSGIRLWVATSETTFVQISWRPGMPAWIIEQQWTGFNGRAQPACNGWSPGSVTYVMFVDENDEVAIYWNDHGNRNSSLSHPVGTWEKASLTLPAVDPSVGLSYGYGGNLFARTSTAGMVLGWNITFDAENTRISGSSLTQVSGVPSVAKSSLASWSITPEVSADDEYEMLVFYQTEGDDISVFSGDVGSGEWTASRLPIPDG